MAEQLRITTILLVAIVAIQSVSAIGPFGGPFGMEGSMPAIGAGIESARATGHAIAAENRAAEAMVDRATGNPIGAAINENRAIGHSVASNVAASRSAMDAGLAGGMGGSGAAALGANVAANVASRSVLGGGVVPPMMPPMGVAGAAAAAGAAAGMVPPPMMGMGGFGMPFMGAGFPAYGAGYGYPYGYPGFVGPLGYGAGSIAYRGIGLRDYLMNDPALRMQREVSRTRVYW